MFQRLGTLQCTFIRNLYPPPPKKNKFRNRGCDSIRHQVSVVVITCQRSYKKPNTFFNFHHHLTINSIMIVLLTRETSPIAVKYNSNVRAIVR